MYEKYWQQMGEKTTIVIPGWQSMSYFSDVKNLCWFLEPEFAKQVVRLHKVVGNAQTEGRHIVVGTGSSQLYLAALFALSPSNGSEPISVVSASPYYSVSLISDVGRFVFVMMKLFDNNKRNSLVFLTFFIEYELKLHMILYLLANP